jgi:hypothetical protein
MTTPTARSRVHRTGVVRTGALKAGKPAASARATRGTPTRPDLWLVPAGDPARAPRSRSRTSRVPFVLLVVALLVGTTIGLLVLNTAIAVDSLKATQLRTGNVQRQEAVQRLQQQVVDGSTPQELAAAAAAAGMVPAAPPGYLVLEGGGGSTVRGTPEPAVPPAPPTPASPAG